MAASLPPRDDRAREIEDAARTGDGVRLRKLLEEEASDAVRRHRAVEIDSLAGALHHLLNHKSTLQDVLPHARFTGPTVPPSLPPDENAATSSSGNAQTQKYAFEGEFSPELLTYSPKLLAERKIALLEHCIRVFDQDKYQKPLIDLSSEDWRIIETFLRLLLPESDVDRIPRKQNEEVAEWHLGRVRAVFAAFIDLHNVMVDKQTARQLAFGADAARIGVFTPDGTFYLKRQPDGEVYPVMQVSGPFRRLPIAAASTSTSDNSSIVVSRFIAVNQPPSSTSATPHLAPAANLAAPRTRSMTGVASSSSRRLTPAVSPLSQKKAKHPILGVTWDIREKMQERQKPFVKLSDLDIQVKEEKLYGKQVLVMKICDVMLTSPPSLRTAVCCDAEASFITFGFHLYRKAPKRKLEGDKDKLQKRPFLLDVGATTYGLAFSPLVSNSSPDLLLAILASIVPESALQRSFATSVSKDTIPELDKHLSRRGYTLSPPSKPSKPSDDSQNLATGTGGSGAGKDGDGEDGYDGPPAERRTGSGGGSGPSGASPWDSSSRGGGEKDREASGGQRTAGNSLGGSSLVVEQPDLEIDIWPVGSVPTDTFTIDPQSPYSARQTPPSSPRDRQVDASPDKSTLVLRPPSAITIFGNKYTRVRPPSDAAAGAEVSASSSPIRLEITAEFVASNEFDVYAARDATSSQNVVIKRSRSAYGSSNLRAEADVLASLAAAGLADVAPPVIGLYEGSGSPLPLALIMQRWGKSIDEGFGSLAVAQRIEIYDLLTKLHVGGYYHADFAARNVVYDGSTFRIIDYECTWFGHECPGHDHCPELTDAQWQLELRFLDDDEL